MALHPLGDQAVLAYCTDEMAATRFASTVRHAALPWVVDVVQAYTSVAIFYDLACIDYPEASKSIASLEIAPPCDSGPGPVFKIPCCYQLGLDWPRLEKYTGLARDEIVRLHSETIYTVYAIGFCPGFPYLGYLPAPLVGVPRLAAPRIKVAAGSIGLTGRQTGIYTEERLAAGTSWAELPLSW